MMVGVVAASTGRPSGAGPPAAYNRHGAMLKAADGDFEACHAFLARHGRLPPLADRSNEGLQLGTQRLGMADREMAHGIAAIWLKPATFGHLTRQQGSPNEFVARRNREVC